MAERPGQIKRLDPDVVSKIAAGEIIVNPAQALKELVENSIDAGAKSITVTVNDGGLKLLQITDDGCGINQADLPLLCERFTTSKLAAFDDLKSISTYGFRGEALASLSHVSRLTVTTAIEGQSGAWRAFYRAGKMVAPANSDSEVKETLVAGNRGTTIKVEDMFYNLPSRLAAFSNSAGAAKREFARVVEMLTQYAVHFDGVTIICKKVGSRDPVLTMSSSTLGARKRLAALYQTAATDLVRVRQGRKVGDRVFQDQDDNDLAQGSPTEADEAADALGYSVSGWVSSGNHRSKKRSTVLLFVNHRAVDCSPLRRALLQLYSHILPRGCHPVIYLDLRILPDQLDVNVHPTKRDVHFLHEDDIIEQICEAVGCALANVEVSRRFSIQTLGSLSGTPSSSQPAEERSQAPHYSQPGMWSVAAGLRPVSQVESAPASPADRPELDDGGRCKFRRGNRPGVGEHGDGGNEESAYDSDEKDDIISPWRISYNRDQAVPSLPFAPTSRTWTIPARTRSDRTLVRTDHRSQKITALFSPLARVNIGSPATGSRGIPTDGGNASLDVGTPSRPSRRQREDSNDGLIADESDDGSVADDRADPSTGSGPSTHIDGSTIPPEPEFRQCTLTSIQTLRNRIRANISPNMTQIIATHSFVGITDPFGRRAVIQAGTKVYLMDYGFFTVRFFYQIGLVEFANFGRIWLNRSGQDENGNFGDEEVGLDVDDLLQLGADYETWLRKPGNKSGAAARAGVNPNSPAPVWEDEIVKVKRILISRKEMLEDYFSISIEIDPTTKSLPIEQVKIRLITIPLLLKGYLPPLSKLPIFLIRLAWAVNWTSEILCFESLLVLLAGLYSPERIPYYPGKPKNGGPYALLPPDPNTPSGAEFEPAVTGPNVDEQVLGLRLVEEVLFPAMKLRLIATTDFDRTPKLMVEIADLRDLYRVFERC